MRDEIIWWAAGILGGSFVWGCSILARAIRECFPKNVTWNTVIRNDEEDDR